MSQSLDRAMTIVWRVAEEPLSINALAEELGVHATTVLRLVQTLTSWRMVERTPSGEVVLGAGLVSLGQRALDDLDIVRVAAPYMKELSAATAETIHLAVLSNDNVVYVDKVDSTHPLRMYSRVGAIAPLHCTGVAKAILAFLGEEDREALLSQVTFRRFNDRTLVTRETLLEDLMRSRERGYAIDDQEHELGIHCIAAPILHANGSVAASISIAAPVARMTRDRLLEFADQLTSATRRASEQIGFQSPVRQ